MVPIASKHGTSPFLDHSHRFGQAPKRVIERRAGIVVPVERWEMIESSSCRLAGGLALSEREGFHVPLLDSSGLAGGRRSLRLDAGS